MRKFSKILAVAMAACMAVAVAGCSNSATSSASGSSSQTASGEAKEIYFLNFKPENADDYAAIAAEYEKETGVKVKVDTAASGKYEETLTTKMTQSNPPTIFQINGPVGYNNWKDYCADIKDSDIFKALKDQNLALSVDGGVYGVPYAIEGYGIIYNNEIMDKYFASAKKTSSIKSVDEINSYAKLKEVVEDMSKIKDELGIEGVFASTSLKTGDDWRWQTHLANIPFYYEWINQDANASAVSTGLKASTVEFKYGENYKNIFDLYINNSCTDPKTLADKSTDDSMAEFALGKVAMVQNGNWAWGQVSGVSGNVVKEDQIKYMPIYTGVEGEETQGLCIGTENYLAINSQVDEATQKASKDFLYWLFSSDYGKKQVVETLGFIAPFSTFTDAEVPADPLAKEVIRYQNDSKIKNLEWAFQAFPSQQWKDNFGAKLQLYAQGQATWEDVSKAAIDDWANEYKLSHE